MKDLFRPALMTGLLILSGCQSEQKMQDSIKKVLKENPSLVMDVVKENPLEFMEVLQNAAKVAQEDMGRKREEEERKQLEASFDSPLVPMIRKDENFRGGKNAQIVLIEYSDFECPYCSRAAKTVENLINKYKDQIKVAYKHLPLDFHPNAMLAAQYYEGIRIQDGAKAWQFHDSIMMDQGKVKAGESFFKELAKKMNLDMKKLESDVRSDAVKKRIEEDKEEAQKFGIQGTPGFILNGVAIKGAYPLEHFEQIIAKLKDKGKLAI